MMSYAYAKVQAWRSRPAPPTTHMMVDAQEREQRAREDERARAIALERHRRKQAAIMGYVRPKEVLDGILYDMGIRAGWR